MTINSNGSMSGKNWSIDTNGKASFSNANITGGSMSGGTIGGKADMNGGTISGAAMTGGSISANQVKVGDRTLTEWCKHIVSDTIETGSLKVKGNTANWESQKVLTGFTQHTHDIKDKTGSEIGQSYTYTFTTRSLHFLGWKV